MISSVETLKLDDTSSIHSCHLSPNTLPRDATPNFEEIDSKVVERPQKAVSSPKMAKVKIIKTKIECVELELEDVTHSPLKELDLAKVGFATEHRPFQRQSQLDGSKLDEISSIDEIRHTFVECREPNGTAYFVEVGAIQNAVENELTEQPEEILGELETNIMKRVLSQSDVETRTTPAVTVIPLRPKAEECESPDEDEEEEEKEVRAIVHTPNTSLAELKEESKHLKVDVDDLEKEHEHENLKFGALKMKFATSADLSSGWKLGGSDDTIHSLDKKLDAPDDKVHFLVEKRVENLNALGKSLDGVNENSEAQNEIFTVLNKSIEVLDEVLDALDEKFSDQSSISNVNVDAIPNLENENEDKNAAASTENIVDSISETLGKNAFVLKENFVSEENSAPSSSVLNETNENSVQNTNVKPSNVPPTLNFPPTPSPTTNETVPGVIRPVDPTSNRPYQKRLPNFQMGLYEAIPKQKLLYEKDAERMAFKMRLENLFNQDDEKSTLRRPKANFSSPTSMHSQRISLNHSTSAPESLILPNSDLEVAKSAVSTVETPSQIPTAPVFNQQLYDTIGRRNRKVFSSVTDVIDIDSTINDNEFNKKGNLSRTKAHENLTALDLDDVEEITIATTTAAAAAAANDDDDNGGNDSNDSEPTNIKQKLEQILSKGRTTQADQSDLERNNNENIRRRTPIQPFDTVRRQKMLFSNVLKSIGPDIHANLHQTHGTAADDIKETIQRRESLD